MPEFLPPDRRSAFMLPPRIPSQPAWTDAADEPVPTLVPLSLREIFSILRRRILVVLLVAIAVAGAVAYLAYRTPLVYRADATLRLTDSRQELTNGLADQSKQSATPERDPLLTQIEVLTSRSVAGKVVDSLPALRMRVAGIPATMVHGLEFVDSVPSDSLHSQLFTVSFSEHAYTVHGRRGVRRAQYGGSVELDGVRFSIAGPPQSHPGTIRILPRDDAITRLSGSIHARPLENTDVIDVSYTAGTPLDAQQVVNTIVRVFRETSIEAAQEQAKLRRQFVEQQLRQNDSLLTAASQALSDFRSREQSFSAKEKFTLERSGLEGLEVQRQNLDADLTMYQSMLTELKGPTVSDRGTMLGALLSTGGSPPNPVVGQLLTQLQRYETVRDSVTTGRWASTTTNPDVQRMNALVASTALKLQATLEHLTTVLGQRLAAIDQQRAQNSAMLDRLPEKEAEEARLVGNEETYKGITDQLRTELQKARLAEAAEIGQVDVLDYAPLPHTPIGIGPLRKLAFGVMVGVMLGGACAFLLEHLNTSIRRREELERALQLPGLAVIPQFVHKPRRRHLLRAGNGAKQANGKQPVERHVGDTLIMLTDLRSTAAEAYRQLRTKLLYARTTHAMKSIVVTSPLPQDGKTTIAANLAAIFAQQRMRVLIIDCDLRRPSLHTIFRVPREPGLTQLLTSDDLITDGVIRPTPVDGLSVVTAGAAVRNATELLGGPIMQRVLATLSESFDVVILDSPPILSVADSAILGSMADSVLLVVRAGQTDRSAAQLALQQLADVGARVVGAVLNDPDTEVPYYDGYEYPAKYGEV
ncbi:MAG TPA: polysaccharide biosynthesis tyrosine autokinase [Gemmatimonadaceae bacterium]|nr:polysaccharide biosynthesis tyrosine autokinase [Gemmatimonadaceae bacterium]